MNNYKLPVLGISLMLLMASCKKQDVLSEKKTASPLVSTTQTSEWKSLNNWTSSKGEQGTTYFSKLTDSTITSDVARSGLVLAFSKNNSGIQALPFTDKNNSYWYYQISKGNISFSSDNRGSAADLDASQFTYFIFSAQKLEALLQSGYSKSKLMQMSYSDIANLFKK